MSIREKHGLLEYPFIGHELEIDGHKYHYLDEGDGEVLLFVHGNPTWSFIWRKFVLAFRDRYRTLAVDHLGCGFSSKPQNYPYRLANHIENLCTLIEKLKLDRITLIGHDWGGCIALGAALRNPERISRIILMNTAGFRPNHIPWRIAACRIPWLGKLMVRGLNLFCRAAVSMLVSNQKGLSKEARKGLLFPYGNWNDRIAIQRFIEDIPISPKHPSYQTLLSIENQLPNLGKLPILLAWGMKDWCFNGSILDRFRLIWPEAEVFPLEEVGHYLFEEAPEKLIERIASFLQTHPD